MKDNTNRFPIYTRLLRLFPSFYRDKYAEQMVHTLADMLDDASGYRSKAKVWLRISLDLPVSLIRQNIIYIGGTMAKEVPNYMKESSILGFALLTPFFIILLVNGLTAHGLYHTWLWHVSVLGIWLLVMPATAVAIAILTLFRWLIERHRLEKVSYWTSLKDIKHSWPLVIILLIGLFIIAVVFGHDSVHCVNPYQNKFWHDFHGTWRCIQRG